LENSSDKDHEVAKNLIRSESPKVKFRWDDNFQRRILGLILTDNFFLIQAKALIQPEYFLNESHVLICQNLYSYFDEYKVMPEKFFIIDMVLNKIKDRNDAVKIFYKNEIENIYEAFVPSPDSRPALLDKILAFAKMQALKIAMDLSQKDLKKDPESEETWTSIYERFQQAMSINKNFEIGFEYFPNLDQIFLDLENEVNPEDKFTSGFSKIDNSLGCGGCKRGEIYSFIGLPGKGKSLCLVKSAVENVKMGKKVVYVSLEMGSLDIAKRFTSQFAMIPYNEIPRHKREIYDLIDINTRSFTDKNRFVIKQFPSGTLDVAGLRSYLEQLIISGFRPDLLIVDYPGEMKDVPGISTWESKYRIMRDLRGLGFIHNICVFVAIQPNKAAASLTLEEYIDESAIGGSFDQVKPLDGLWSINQTNDETTAGFGRLFVVKHRNGKSKFAFPVKYDKETLDINECSEGEYRIALNNVYTERADHANIDGKQQSKNKQKKDLKEEDLDYAE
jgi:replicative DNA helicase